ncbi:MAG: hypothetical protein KDC88_03855 [Ignavibacteriae bacterium]|nr:hypothetical protein [Ignavibacteriota bacterium]MCB9207865.1 hypothetical protein [Ignavibacteriales bacterium]MCB9258634.1 hypothetical protein [Ignavibacteriales bacterium]
MNTGQMMIGIAALGLVTFTVLNFNRGSINTQDALIYNKEFILATTIAQSVLDEVSGKAFDEEIVEGNDIFSASDFSNKLEADPGEVYPNFDDVDDFNNYTRTDSIPQMGVFDISVSVDWMSDGLVKTISKTYNKNVTIRVTSPALTNFFTEKQDTIVLTSLFSQWILL